VEKAINITGLAAAMAGPKAVSDFLMSTVPMQGLCDSTKAVIIEKTASGRDYMNRSFQPYSKAYAKRTGKTRVDLRVSGRMLDSITAKALSPQRGEVKVTDHALIAEFHNQGGPKSGKPPKRTFMDINPTQLAKAVKENFDDPIMKLLGRR
jgi:hypothetical protein